MPLGEGCERMRIVNDRRSSARVTVRGEVVLYTPRGMLCCRCVDLGMRGMSVRSPLVVRPRERVRLDASFEGRRMVIDATVMRRQRSREGHVLALRFDGVGSQAHAWLEALLRVMQAQSVLAKHASALVAQLPRLEIPRPEPPPPPMSYVAPQPAAAHVSLEHGWTDEELATTHYRSPPVPVRTGETVVMRAPVPDLPRLSPDLEVALDRLRRRELGEGS